MIIHASEYSERKQFNPYVAIGGGYFHFVLKNTIATLGLRKKETVSCLNNELGLEGLTLYSF